MAMSGGEDWLVRPVLEGMILYTDLKRTELDLCDIAIMNEALEVKQENSIRVNRRIDGY